MKYLIVMESNLTMFEETIYNVTYPLYATYMKLFGFLFMAILVVISSSYVIHVILKNKELRNTNNILIINLLITDIITCATLCLVGVPLIIAYLTGVEIHANCNIITPMIEWIVLSTRMMILPPAAHRFICVARPFTHKSIMTKKRIIMMIVVLWVIPIVPRILLGSNGPVVYIPSLGGCATVASGIEIGVLIAMLGYASSFVLTITSAIYLRHKIIHVKAYIRELHRCGMERGKLSKSQRLKELLTEQFKPTIAVFVVGGVDAVGNLLFAIIALYIQISTTPIERFQIFQIVVVPLLFLQLLSHSLSYGLYNKNIPDEMRPCYPKRSQVIVINRQ